jgi:hypothetical protein
MRRLAVLLPLLILGLMLAGVANAASPSPPPVGPPYPDPVDGQRVYDYAGVSAVDRDAQAEQIVDADRGADEGRDRGLHAGHRPRRHHHGGGRGRRRPR